MKKAVWKAKTKKRREGSDIRAESKDIEEKKRKHESGKT